MPVLSEALVERFADLCHVAHRSWTTWRTLYDGIRQSGDFSKVMPCEAALAFDLLMQTCQEHAILQIAKLHDRVAIAGNVTLGLEFVARYGGWERAIGDRLDALRKDLDKLSQPLRENLRNKRLAHNDLAAVVAGGTSVIFAEGQDEVYFSKLWAFLDLVYVEVKGGTFARSDEPRRCAEQLSRWLARTVSTGDTRTI